jgi:protein-tyrosine kinase
MNGSVYQETRWNGGNGVIRRLHGAGHYLARLLAGWFDSAAEDIVEDADVRPGTKETRAARHQATVDELVRQEEIKLVQRLFLAPGAKRRVVLFAGVDDDNGCGRICLRAGQTLARLTPRSVCVVDANVRAPGLHTLAGAETRDGLAAAVADPGAVRTFAQRLVPQNLWLLPSAPVPDPDLLLTIDRVQPCLKELGAHFDHVIVHTPPINVYAESLALSQVVDGVLLVLEANRTRREIVRSVKARLEDLDVPLLGIVLTNRTFPIPTAVYRLL